MSFKWNHLIEFPLFSCLHFSCFTVLMINGSSLFLWIWIKMKLFSCFPWERASEVEIELWKIWNIICVSQIIMIIWWEIKRQSIWKLAHHVHAFRPICHWWFGKFFFFCLFIICSDGIIYYLLFLLSTFSICLDDSIHHLNAVYLDCFQRFYAVIFHCLKHSILCMPFNVMFIESHRSIDWTASLFLLSLGSWI